MRCSKLVCELTSRLGSAKDSHIEMLTVRIVLKRTEKQDSIEAIMVTAIAKIKCHHGQARESEWELSWATDTEYDFQSDHRNMPVSTEITTRKMIAIGNHLARSGRSTSLEPMRISA